MVEIGVAVLFVFLLFLIMMATQSRNPATQKMGQEWAKRLNQTREQTKDQPAEVQAATLLEETKKIGKETADRAREERDKCQNSLDPKKLQECASEFKRLSEAIQSLLEKLKKPLGGGITPDSLAKGISESMKAVWEAEAELGKCTGCPNMW
jgi:hypothetical protein